MKVSMNEWMKRFKFRLAKINKIIIIFLMILGLRTEQLCLLWTI